MCPEQLRPVPGSDPGSRRAPLAGPGRTAVGCHARPMGAQTGYSEDAQCACAATTLVHFAGGHVPVCSLHEATYRRWARDAEANAAAYWLWRRD